MNGKVLYSQMLHPTFNDFVSKVNDCKNIIDNLIVTHSIIKDFVEKINKCKNNFWESELIFDYNVNPQIKIDQKIFKSKKSYLSTYEKIRFYNSSTYSEKEIGKRIESAMYKVFKNMERCGYRVMEERN